MSTPIVPGTGESGPTNPGAETRIHAVDHVKDHPLRILVLCRPYLGDLVLSGPVFRNLRAWRPDARIVAGVYPESAAPLSFFPEIDEIITIPRHRRGDRLAFVREWLAALRRVRRERFDLVYDLLHTDRSSLVTLASGAPERVGFIKDQHRLRHRVYTTASAWTPDLDRSHTVDLFLRALTEIGMPVQTRSIAITVPPEEAESAAARLRRIVPPRSGPRVLVHPGAGTPNRLWPPERFSAVCDDLQENLGAQVVLMGGPGEAATLAAIRSGMRTPSVVFDERVSIREFAALLQQGELFLGLDSGPAHLAAAVGTRVVALFGAALPAQWRPLGEGHTVVRPSMPCDPCACPQLCRPPNPYHMFCIRRLAPADVSAALRLQLEGRHDEFRENLLA